jgi:hypothetical protein
LNDLIAVRRLLGEEDEDGGADVAAGGTPAGTEPLTEASGATETGGEVWGVKGRPSPAVAAAHAMLEVLADVVEARGGVVVCPRPLIVGRRAGSFSGHVGSLHGG